MASNWTWLQPPSLRRYLRLCDEMSPGQEPQCWMAETEVGEAWRAMPRPLRVALCAQAGWLDAVWEAWPRLGRAVDVFLRPDLPCEVDPGLD